MTAPPQTPQPRVLLSALLCTIVALLTDLASKWWALETLNDGRRVEIFGQWLSLRLVFNPGAAFSLGDNFTLVLTAIAAIISVVVVGAIWRATSVLQAGILGLLLGGALGNLYDRLFQPPAVARGHVVDFIDYNGWFVGNVADIWIVCAATALVFLLSRTQRPTSTTSVEGTPRG